WSKSCLWLVGVKVKVIGNENYDHDGTYVVVSNHASMTDIPAILVGIDLNLRLVAKEELGRIPIFGWGLHFGDFILIKRGQNKEALRSLFMAEEKLRDGKSVHLFADGTRSTDGSIKPFKRGAFLLAARANVPVLPVTILGSHRITGKGSFKMFPGTIRLVIDKPIDPSQKSINAADELNRQAFDAVAKNYDLYVSQ
ncbi:MAG: 1-acyl-sn-glycerol-3-phosphate acyltransferase, partial [Chlorobiales bacterium]|nr:1-acyl-sn-glycerol-3-phosphate acyltransferase [Chlorobiales bacterium]